MRGMESLNDIRRLVSDLRVAYGSFDNPNFVELNRRLVQTPEWIAQGLAFFGQLGGVVRNNPIGDSDSLAWVVILPPGELLESVIVSMSIVGKYAIASRLVDSSGPGPVQWEQTALSDLEPSGQTEREAKILEWFRARNWILLRGSDLKLRMPVRLKMFGRRGPKLIQLLFDVGV